ncbi:Fasciclin domain protein [Rhodobacteraceae bacterium THAF1]|uniref:fasciclin domain-containing protein n=1 Tax=Palleronia sp. THAF1 TaxID=2587842 RepID=UPI000F3B113D|nr:fasciclin domain-containing protein [Palleronia sp. THAF1]QFU07117.1 Fasciclin domain protein [Palleronia sp. THAF1]VDC16730.1 Fasciclin domain protein [Rhodobacteraceae bacterium THAF1]
MIIVPRSFKLALAVVSFAITLAAPATAQGVMETLDARFPAFADVVRQAGLDRDAELAGMVLAPTDAAVAAFDPNLDDAPDALDAVVQLHLIPGRPLDAASLPRELTAQNGATITVAAGGGVTFTGPSGTTAQLVVPNLDGGLATIHGIDAVLRPDDLDALLAQGTDGTEATPAVEERPDTPDIPEDPTEVAEQIDDDQVRVAGTEPSEATEQTSPQSTSDAENADTAVEDILETDSGPSPVDEAAIEAPPEAEEAQPGPPRGASLDPTPTTPPGRIISLPPRTVSGGMDIDLSDMQTDDSLNLATLPGRPVRSADGTDLGRAITILLTLGDPLTGRLIYRTPDGATRSAALDRVSDAGDGAALIVREGTDDGR